MLLQESGHARRQDNPPYLNLVYKRCIEENPAHLPPSSGLPSLLEIPKAEFNGKRGIWNPMLEMTIRITSPYLIVDNEVQLCTPGRRMQTNVFPFFKNGTINKITKGGVQGRGKERGLLTLQLHIL